MPRIKYTEQQLLALQHSPLVKRPENLPRIEQWLEIPADQAQRRPKTSNGKAEENENPNTTKRPSLFETRQVSRHSLTGEDVFLGPRVSFASASAARHKERGANGEERTSLEEVRSKFDRFSSRKEGYSKDRDGRDKDEHKQKGRPGLQNGHNDEENTVDSRMRRGNEYDKSKDGGVALEPGGNRRSTGLRNKFDQPWFRESNKPETKEEDEHEGKGEYRGWRERERKHDSWSREPRTEREPQWMQEAASDDNIDHTPDDFAKWKESMKASEAKSEEPSNEQSQQSDRPVAPTLDTTSLMPSRLPEGPFFGIFGATKVNEASQELPTPKTAAPTKKSSRFAGFFAPPQEGTQPDASLSPVMEPKSAPPLQTTSEDKEGFNRMMQMLRMGGGSGTGPPPPQSALPPSTQPQQNRPPAARNVSRDSNILHSENAPQRPVMSPELSSATIKPTGPSGLPRGEPPSRDSQFLLKLMQQPRSPFPDGQIYGQVYHGRDSPVNSILNSFAAKHQEPQAKGAAQMSPNDQGFPHHQPGDHGKPHNQRPGAPPNFPQDDRFGPPPPQRTPQEYQYRDITPIDQPMRIPRDLPPPPGFNSMRAGPPPGFPAYQGNGPPHIQPPPPSQPSHNMRAVPPQPPPGFFPSPPPQGLPPGPPPGFLPQQVNGPQQQHHHQQYHQQSQQQQQQQRRPQMQMGAPPGYEGFNEAQRRGPPLPNQMQYPQY